MLYRNRPNLLERVDFLRLDACRKADEAYKATNGQFLTPMPLARFMANLFECTSRSIHILDAGAGVGSLFAAYVYALCQKETRPREIRVTAYEIDPKLAAYLSDTLALCQRECAEAGIQFTSNVIEADFIESASDLLSGGLFASPFQPTYDCAILNPPYKKIRTESKTRRFLERIGAETTNLYTGFLAATMQLLKPFGELVAITPRSFCNGPYFTRFRKSFLSTMNLRRLHLFHSREQAFQDDAVLQENLILYARKEAEKSEQVSITTSMSPEDDFLSWRMMEYTQLVHPEDPHAFIHIVADELGQHVIERMKHFTCTLAKLNLSVSTGRVVDFRAEEYLRQQPEPTTVPLIYPTHFDHGYITWPKEESRKPNALVDTLETQALLVPNENYVLVKRFSAKEEKKRIVAAIYEAERNPSRNVGFENHLNYFHLHGRGLPLTLAKGLAAFLNSTLVDLYFRQFNGHTQVNATDLRNMTYPSLNQLELLGAQIGAEDLDQDVVDGLIERELLGMAEFQGDNPIKAKRRIEEALQILKDLGLPRAQLNERSALTLLALLDLKPETSWKDASNPLCGITPLMEYFAKHYGKASAPNTRETVRRQTVHQFLDAGIVIPNPDDRSRPVNSPKAVYQIDQSTLELLRTFGTPDWDHSLRTYLASVETLKKRYAQERVMNRIPVHIAPGKTITLSPGGQNILIEQIITEFAERFTPGGIVLYIGDTDNKFAYCDRESIAALGIEIEVHGKMPDVIIHSTTRDWLVLIEAVTSHGPIDPKRRDELKHLFHHSRAGLVFVTAFLSRRAMIEYLNDISWETEVWVAEAPAHLIHFNGERFLGPY